ncbi:MAG TPA: POTRA domain-containing protein [Bryobacteraceae bacterium]|nr:POTRA domain-containing protein [Bryobacteraceae bacterium]
MRSIACAALFCSLALFAGAQTPSAKPPAKREPPPGALHSLAVKGNKLYSAEDIAKASGLKQGQRVSAAILEEARLKLQGTELFSNVTHEYRFTAGTPPEYNVTFEVSEIEQLYPMRFERLGPTPEAVRDYLKTHIDLYSDRIPGTEGVLKRYTEAVRQFVSETKPDTKVRAAISNDDPKELAVLFSPVTPAPAISQVFVTGNEAVDTGTILRAVNQVAVGAPLSDTRLKMILDNAIKPLYAAKGYAAVTFPKVETEPSKNNLGVIVRVEIKDGPVFRFGSLRFRGKNMDEDEIRSAITFKTGQTFDAEKMDNFRLELIRRMKRHGLLDASVTNETEIDAEKRAVNVIYNVIPGEPYKFAALDIQGLDMTARPAIEKLWGEKPGQPFNPDYPEFFLKKVNEQGLFDNLADTHSDYTADASSHNVMVHLYFKGGKSAAAKAQEKKEEEERRKASGTWSPYP